MTIGGGLADEDVAPDLEVEVQSTSSIREIGRLDTRFPGPGPPPAPLTAGEGDGEGERGEGESERDVEPVPLGRRCFRCRRAGAELQLLTGSTWLCPNWSCANEIKSPQAQLSYSLRNRSSHCVINSNGQIVLWPGRGTWAPRFRNLNV